MNLRLPLLLLGLFATIDAVAAPHADLIIHNARIHTVDENRPLVTALAIADGRILFAGSDRAAMTYRSRATEVLNLEGATVIPGMIDAHAHLLGLGMGLRQVDLRDTRSYDEVIARVRERAEHMPAGSWIVGRGWDQNDWADTRFPTHTALSRAVPDHPVFLSRVDGHAGLANAAALTLAKIGKATADPAGGRIERDTDGIPSGVLVDNAMDLVDAIIPAADADERAQAITAAIAELNRWGLTGIHDAGVARSTIDTYEALARAGRYPLRNHVMVAGDDTTLAHYLKRGPQRGLYDKHLWIAAIKLSADGALGSRGASLLEPYSDAPNQSGLALIPAGRVHDVAVRALRGGFQLNTHAIGDRANRSVLDEIAQALEEVPVADHRFRIEHAQVLHPDDIPRFAELGVIPSMQASHQTSDMYWAGNRIGPTRELGAYAWRSLLDSGVIIPNGSDLPVEQSNPLISFQAAVSRQDAKAWPAGGWHPEQRMSRAEALKSITLWPAFAAFMEADVGSLSPGKLADFVVLDQDIMQVPSALILHTQVLSTWLGGHKVYARERAADDAVL
jgi:predicted amidohydrolase YtcJ